MSFPTLVIKYGGSVVDDTSLRGKFFSELKMLQRRYRIVMVHGGGKEITSLAGKVGIETRFKDGLRYTDKDMLEIVVMVLAGKINKFIVSQLLKSGVRAVGVSGVDNNLIVGVREVSLGYVGKECRCNPELLEELLKLRYVVVVSSVGCGEDGEILNFNADDVAYSIGEGLGAQKLVFITDVPGVIVNNKVPGDSKAKKMVKEVVKSLHVDRVEDFINSGIISGGMIPKVKAAKQFILSAKNRKREVYITNYEKGLFSGTKIFN
jgi:acetylglutamate kinase